jgi:hypothetical protein
MAGYSKRTNGVKGMIALEQKMLPELLKTSTQKAEKLIELLQSKGTNFAEAMSISNLPQNFNL